jgi:single-stranded DNA-binding protein
LYGLSKILGASAPKTAKRKGGISEMLVNEIHLSGVVATEPKQFSAGPIKFRLAHGGGGKRKDGTPWPTQFFSVSVWDKGIVEGLAKGARVDLFGKLRHNQFTDKQGNHRETVEIVADTISLKESGEKLPAPITPNYHGVGVTDEDVPF